MTSDAVLVDGRPLQEPYLDLPGGMGYTAAWESAADEYVVMGDNRFYACDSRVFGPVPRESISHVVDA